MKKTTPQDHLFRETAAAKALVENYQALFEGDNELQRDTVEGATNLVEAMEWAIKAAGQDKAAIAALDEYIKELTARKDRLKRRLESTRAMMNAALEQSGRNTISTPYGSASRTPVAGKLEIDPEKESEIPAKFWKRGDPVLDKVELLKAVKALKDDEKIPGASLGEGGWTVTLRLK